MPEHDEGAVGFEYLPDLKARGTLSTAYDAAADIIRIKAEGLWEVGQIEHCFETLAYIRDSDWRDAHLRVLVDRRDTVVQSARTADRLQKLTETFYRPGDRVAVIVDNSLLKMQLKSVLDSTSHSLFISESAALLWLNAGKALGSVPAMPQPPKID